MYKQEGFVSTVRYIYLIGVKVKQHKRKNTVPSKKSTFCAVKGFRNYKRLS